MKASLFVSLVMGAALLPPLAQAQSPAVPSGSNPFGLWMTPGGGYGTPPAGTPSVTPDPDHTGLWMTPNGGEGTQHPLYTATPVPSAPIYEAPLHGAARASGDGEGVTPSVPIFEAPIRPPTLQHEAQPPRPAQGHAQWVGGYWRWTGVTYAWNPGQWTEPPSAGVTWAAPRWEHRRNSWVMNGGSWRTIVIRPSSRAQSRR